MPFSALSSLRSARVMRGVFAALVAMLVVLGLSPVARAAQIDAVDPDSLVYTVCPTGQGSCSSTTAGDSSPSSITQWSAVRMDMDWKAPSGAQPGDTFTIGLSEPYSAYSGTFALPASDGTEVGTCTADKSTNVVTCKLNDYIATHEDVGGTLWFAVQATTQTESTTSTLTLSGSTVQVPSPTVGPQIDPAGDWNGKDGWVLYPDSPGDPAVLQWQVRLSSSQIADGSGATLTDELAGSQTFQESALTPEVIYAKLGDPIEPGTTLDPSLYTVDIVDPTHLSIHVPDLHAEGLLPADTAYQYRIRYRSVPDDATQVATGTYWTNQVSVGTFTQTAKSSYAATGGGTGSGSQSGGFTVAKDVEGVSGSAASSHTFPVHATYTLNGQTVTKDIALDADGTPQGLSGLPVGTEVTLTEDPVELDGYTLESATFSASTLNDAIKISDDGKSATVKIVYGTLRLNLTNTYSEVTTPPTEEPTTPAPTEEPTTPAPTEEPTTPAPTEEPTTPAPTEEPTTPGTSDDGGEPTTPAPTEEPTTPGTSDDGGEPTTPAPTEEPTTPGTSDDGGEPTTPAPTEEPTTPGTPGDGGESTPASKTPTEEPTTPAPSDNGGGGQPSEGPSGHSGGTPGSSGTPGTGSSTSHGGQASGGGQTSGTSASGGAAASGSSTAPQRQGLLPRTGADVLLTGSIALSLIAAGLILYGLARRRES